MELGSEFNLSLSELTIVENNAFSYIEHTGMESIYFDSGRSAIKYLKANVDIGGEVLLPEFICESVIRCFPEDKVKFYKVSEKFIVDVDDIKNKLSTKTRAIFLMHYFGSLQPKNMQDQIKQLAIDNNILIIEDATHSLFSLPHTIGDYVIASIRKWMQIPSGGVLLSKNKFNYSTLEKYSDNFKANGMVLKDMFLKGELDCNPAYRKIFMESKEKLDVQREAFQISDFSEFIMTCVDTTVLIEKRKNNYIQLKSFLSSYGVKPAIELDEKCCPLVLPIRVPNRDSFRKYLMENRIYCAVHWPRDGIREGERIQAVKNSSELISLPIDQRYDETHLEYMNEVIGRYGGGKLQF